jgi:3-hydroxybutyryl-CoA dehydrogenase
MGIAVISDETLKLELCGEAVVPPEIKWVASVGEVPPGTKTIADLLFENSRERIDLLKKTGAENIIINSVSDTLSETDMSFTRINGWPTFLQGATLECAGEKDHRRATEEFLKLFGRKAEWVSDEAGFITPRVVSMIINEAYFALSENVSTKEEINTAMKLGTNYPFGPFQWAEKIGLEKVYKLLSKLSETNDRYKPAPGLASTS